MRVVFESGIGANEVGEPGGTFELGLDVVAPAGAEPPPGTWARTSARTSRRPDGARRADAFRFDPEAGGSTLFGGTGDYPLLDPLWDTDWTRFDPARSCRT